MLAALPAVLYGLSAAAYAAAAGARRPVWTGRGRTLAAAGLAVHAAVWLGRLGDGRLPFEDLGGTLFVLGGLLAAVSLAAGAALRRRRAAPEGEPSADPPAVQVVAMALAAGAAAAGAASGRAARAGEPFPTLPLAVHAGFLAVGCAALFVAAAAGAAYLLEERQIKERRPGRLYFRLPPLDRSGALLGRLLAAGWGLFTVGLAAGAAWLVRETGSPFGGAGPSGGAWEVVAAYALWAYYALALAAGRGAGGRARSARLAVGGGAAILVILAGIALAPGLHEAAGR